MILTRRHAPACLAAAALLLVCGGTAAPQSRVSDKDLEKLMGNLKEDSKKFASSFKADVSKSPIRKTSEGKSAKQLADQFSKQVQGLLNEFKSKKQAGNALPVVNQSYNQLNAYLGQMSPSAGTAASWSKVQDELGRINAAFNYTPGA